MEVAPRVGSITPPNLVDAGRPVGFGVSVQGWIWLRLKTWLFLINDPPAVPC